MNIRINWIYTILCSVALTGCSTVKVIKPVVIKPVDVSGTDIQLPVSSLAFTSGDDFTLECRQALDIVGDPNLSTKVEEQLADFRENLEQSLTASGFAFSNSQNKVYIRLKVANFSYNPRVNWWNPQYYDLESERKRYPSAGVLVIDGNELEGFFLGNSLNSVVFQTEYLNVKGQTLGIIQQEWHSSDSLEEAAKEVAKFTRRKFGTRK